jgi:hypothetical protein
MVKILILHSYHVSSLSAIGGIMGIASISVKQGNQIARKFSADKTHELSDLRFPLMGSNPSG